MNALFPISFYKQTMMDPSSKVSEKSQRNDDLIKIGKVEQMNAIHMLAKCFEIRILNQNSYINPILFLKIIN